jgi:diadenosine tetraphosphatase ApaH/serine/threonine PP2A family protein phosphatase
MSVARKVVGNPELADRLSAGELVELLEEARSVFRTEPQLLELEGSALVVGDTHGDFESSRRALSEEAKLTLFLGDYVDRGLEQLKNVNFLLAEKVERPERVYLLRGNHESPLMNYSYGFYWEVVGRYGPRVYRMYAEVFSSMPYAAVLNGEVFAVHGGVAEGLSSVETVRGLPKGDLEPSDPIALQLLWNDPDESVEYFAPSPRGPGINLYGRRAVEEFFAANGLKLMVRAHEYFPEGFHEYFGGMVLSLFSCRYYPATRPKAALLEGASWRLVALT